jgi:hypothetical protein
MQYESFLDNARLERCKEHLAKMELAALVAEYEKLLDAVESADLAQAEIAEGELDNFLSRFPNIANYDSRGNYIGTMRNENGWTP